MTRSRWILPALVLVAAGCGKSAPPPPPVTPAPATSTATDAAIAPDPVQPQPTTAAKTPAAAQPAADGGLRTMLARYLDADGQGGFRPNEKAATEVEKLAPQPGQLIPLV